MKITRIFRIFVALLLALASSFAYAAGTSFFYRIVFSDRQAGWLFASAHTGYQQDENVKKALDVLLSKSTRIGVENYYGFDHREKVAYLRANYKGPQLDELAPDAQACLRKMMQLSRLPKFASKPEFDLPPPAFSLYFALALMPHGTTVRRPTAQFGWDTYIVNYAFSKHSGVEEIEASVGQMQFFNSLERDEINQMSENLCKLAKDQEKLRKRESLLKPQMGAYESHDFEKLYRLLKQSGVDYDGWSEVTVRKFLDDRNAYFAKRIIELNRTKKVDFFAVGAAHFGGEDSVPRQLKKLGVKVVPVPLSEIAP